MQTIGSDCDRARILPPATSNQSVADRIATLDDKVEFPSTARSIAAYPFRCSKARASPDGEIALENRREALHTDRVELLGAELLMPMPGTGIGHPPRVRDTASALLRTRRVGRDADELEPHLRQAATAGVSGGSGMIDVAHETLKLDLVPPARNGLAAGMRYVASGVSLLTAGLCRGLRETDTPSAELFKQAVSNGSPLQVRRTVADARE